MLLPVSVAFQAVSPWTSIRDGSQAFHRIAPFHAHHRDQETWKAQREEAKAALERMDALESSIREGGSSLTVLREELNQVEQDVTKLTSELLPPLGVSLEDYRASIQSYLRLPLSMRLALCQVLEMQDAAKDWTLAPDIVTRLYEQRRTLTAQQLEDALKDVERRMNGVSVLEKEAEEILADLLEGKSVDAMEREGFAKQLLPRVTRKEGKFATPQELEVLMNVLDKSTFALNGKPETIPGGYIIRGRNTMRSGRELIEVLDAKLPTQWTAQVSLFPDFAVDDDSVMADDNVLLLLKNDFAPTTSRWLLSFCTAAACATAISFSVGCYVANENVAQHMQELMAAQDYSRISWFNNLLAQLLFPLGVIQVMHEIGHLGVAWRDKIKSSPPTLLPFSVLPYLGTKTDIKTSPRDMTSLFDFAFLGPFLGLCTSVIFLFTGLQSTLIADADVAQYFPAIPVNVLQLSTLGGSIIDYVFGGAGIVTTQDPTTTIPLHPFAIAGFSGLMLNSLEMLPLGSTDGGRLSQALFGRSTHSIIGGATWFSLLMGSFLLEQQDVLIAAWVMNNIVQNDMEVPCRNEVDPVNVPRSLAAFALWFVAILTFTPMSVVM